MADAPTADAPMAGAPMAGRDSSPGRLRLEGPPARRSKTPTARAMARLVAGGVLTLVLLLGGGGAWAAFARLSSAIIAPGTVMIDGENKRVQHQTGGIVAAIRAHDGDRVAAGDVLVRLDDTQLRANREIVAGRLVEYRARLARLEAERDGLAAVAFPADLAAKRGEPEVAKALDGETILFEARRTTLAGQISQLDERVGQLREQIVGLEAQKTAKEGELVLIAGELAGLEELLAKGHVPVTRVIALKRETAAIEGEVGSLVSQIAATRGRITETELQIIQSRSDFTEKVAEGIRQAQAETGPLSEQLISAEDQLARTEIRAPRAGIVHELAVHTVGGVIAPGETILKIVPKDDGVVLDTRVPPTRIDDVRVGQPARVAFAGLDSRSTPMLKAHVVYVSADASRNEQGDQVFYVARLALDAGEIDRLGGKAVQPGMPVEVFIETGERTVFDYLVDPLLRSTRHALREG